MSNATLEHDLAQYLANTGYVVRFNHAHSYDWFYTYVLFDDKVIAEKACCRRYTRAARWAKKRIRDHQKGVRMLGGVIG